MPGVPLAVDTGAASRRHPLPLLFEPSYWVPLLRALTPRTRFISLPRPFLDYLLSDGVYAYDDSTTTTTCEDDEWGGDTTNERTEAGGLAEHVGVINEIERVILELDGAVSPKVGTRCPIDATWISFNGNTKCENAHEVLTLIKSSDRVAAYIKASDTGDVKMVLRQWADLNPSMEFRCFVKNENVVAVSQRDTSACFEFLAMQKDSVVEKVTEVFERRIKERVGMDTFVMDVYIDQRQKLWVVDLAPWGGSTDPLLYSWEELARIEDGLRQGRQEEICALQGGGIMNSFDGSAWFRCVASNCGIKPSRSMYHGLPLDLQGAAGGAAVAEAAKRLEEAARQQNAASAQ